MSHNRRSSPPAAVAPSANHPFTSRFSPELARILRRGRDLLEGPGVVAHDFVLLEGQGSRVPRPDHAPGSSSTTAQRPWGASTRGSGAAGQRRARCRSPPPRLPLLRALGPLGHGRLRMVWRRGRALLRGPRPALRVAQGRALGPRRVRGSLTTRSWLLRRSPRARHSRHSRTATSGPTSTGTACRRCART